MKKWMLGILLSFVVLVIGVAQPTLAAGNSNKTASSSMRSALKKRFKKVPPKKHKKRNRINYYKFKGGYIGVYL